MCQQCLDIVNKYYPDLSEDEDIVLLANATCFPFGLPADVERQVKELVENTDGTLEAALAYAGEKHAEDMAHAMGVMTS